jgi:predicted metal-dependent hydrolase
MDRAWLEGDPPVEITVRRSASARRYSLRVSGLDGRVTLTLPARGSLAEALAFARSRETWIRRALAQQAPAADVTHGMRLPFEGRLLLVTPGPVRAARAEGNLLLVPPDAAPGPRIAAFLKAAARRRLADSVAAHAARLGRSPGRITLRDPRSRWGSCSAAGDLMFSWRLVMAPPEVLDYVAAHEVAHLAEMNHSPAFWKVVARLCPGHVPLRAWLRREGATLHRYRFGD